MGLTTFTSLGLQKTGMSRGKANFIDGAVSFASGAGGLRQGATKTAKALLHPRAQGKGVSQVLKEYDTGAQALNKADWKALGGLRSHPLEKAHAIGNGYQITTTKVQAFGKSLQLWKTGLTPRNDLFAGGAAAVSGILKASGK